MPAPRDDHALLRAYVDQGDGDAFAELVARHADMVYAAALRQVGRCGLADDVTQAAFILLARKASKISAQVVVAAWLHKATRYAALNAMKTEHRRREHERRAGELAAAATRQAAPAGATAGISWAQGAALLDECVAGWAPATARRSCCGSSNAAASPMSGTPWASPRRRAQMRVGRAIAKLREFFRRKGVPISVSTLRAAVAANAVVAAPNTLKLTLAPAAIAAARADGIGVPNGETSGGSHTADSVAASRYGSIADQAGRAMDFAAARSALMCGAAGLAAAALIALLLFPWVTGDSRAAPTATTISPATQALAAEGGPSTSVADGDGDAARGAPPISAPADRHDPADDEMVMRR
jgi:hypothetical protein